MIWDVERGEILGSLDGHRGNVTATTISPDGAWLATGDMHGTIRVWSTSSLHLEHEIVGRRTSISDLAVSPDSRWLAATDDAGGAGAVRIIDPRHEPS
ncbi:WD40 repeat domain-containing protein [Actinoplanes sp. CA-054009]